MIILLEAIFEKRQINMHFSFLLKPVSILVYCPSLLPRRIVFKPHCMIGRISSCCQRLHTWMSGLQQTPGCGYGSSALGRRVDQHRHSCARQKTRVPVAALQDRSCKQLYQPMLII